MPDRAWNAPRTGTQYCRELNAVIKSGFTFRVFDVAFDQVPHLMPVIFRLDGLRHFFHSTKEIRVSRPISMCVEPAGARNSGFNLM